MSSIKSAIVFGLILLFAFAGLGCLSASTDDDLTVIIKCPAAYHASIEWTKDGHPVNDSAEFTKAGDYSLNIQGKNVTVTAFASKIDPNNLEDELKLRIDGRNEVKQASTFYPDDEIGGTLTGEEDRNFKK